MYTGRMIVDRSTLMPKFLEIARGEGVPQHQLSILLLRIVVFSSPLIINIATVDNRK